MYSLSLRVCRRLEIRRLNIHIKLCGQKMGHFFEDKLLFIAKKLMFVYNRFLHQFN